MDKLLSQHRKQVGAFEVVDFVDEAEIEARRQHDPLLAAGARLDEAERLAIEQGCESRLASAIEAAEAALPAGAAA